MMAATYSTNVNLTHRRQYELLFIFVLFGLGMSWKVQLLTESYVGRRHRELTLPPSQCRTVDTFDHVAAMIKVALLRSGINVQLLIYRGVSVDRLG